jgi:hypothetical protein
MVESAPRDIHRVIHVLARQPHLPSYLLQLSRLLSKWATPHLQFQEIIRILKGVVRVEEDKKGDGVVEQGRRSLAEISPTAWSSARCVTLHIGIAKLTHSPQAHFHRSPVTHASPRLPRWAMAWGKRGEAWVTGERWK